MKFLKKFILIIFIGLTYCITANAADNLFEEAKKKFLTHRRRATKNRPAVRFDADV